MIYQGSFNDIQGRTVTVRIESGTGTAVKEIGERDGGLYFTTDPVETNHAYNDQFDVVMRESCTIRLLSEEPLTELYSRDVLQNKVTVTRGTETIFMGYVEPQAFSQPFNSRLDEVELSCIDIFSAMQYLVWEGVSRSDVDYDRKKSEATGMSAGAILTKCLDAVAPGVASSSDGVPCVGNSNVSAMIGMYIDTTVFFGDDEESAWTLLDVTEAILTYLNLRMCLYNGAVRTYHPDKLGTGGTVAISKSKAWDKKHQIEVSETYNKLSLSVERDTVETIMPNILDDETLVRLYSARQLWCSEYMSPRAWDMFYAMGVTTQERACNHARRKDHYIRVLNAPGWTFGGMTPPNHTTHLDDYIEHYDPASHPQEEGVNQLQPNMGAMLLEVATGDQKYGYEDNAVTNELTTGKYLVIGVDGQAGDVKSDTDTQAVADSYSTKLKTAMPVAEYTGGEVQLSPADETTTRYVVFSGSMRLNPVHKPVKIAEAYLLQSKSMLQPIVDSFMTEVTKKTKTDAQRLANTWAQSKFNAMQVVDPWTFEEIVNGKGAPASYDFSILKQEYASDGYDVLLFRQLRMLPKEKYDKDSEENEVDHKRYYTRRYWHCETPESTPSAIMKVTGTGAMFPVEETYGLFPIEDDDVYANFEYKYSSVDGFSIDEVSQLPLLQCMLIVGDKCVVQTGMPSTYGDRMECYEWKTYKTRAQCASDEEYYLQSFTLGIDIKIKDKIIGPEYDIANNISYRLGLDAKGTAIPVRKSDNVNGAVKFMILGPFNALWKDILRRAPTMWSYTKWDALQVVLLNHISAIWMKDFSVEIKMAQDDDLEDGDLVYTSDTDEAFVNKKDDLTFKFATALTAEERKELGVLDMVCRNTPVNTLTGESLLSIRDTVRNVQGKPEQLYLDWHWNKAHRARVSLIHGLKDTDGTVDRFKSYTHPALPGKQFCVDGISRNLRDGSAQIRMTEK